MPTRSRSWARNMFRKLSGWLVYRYRVARRIIIHIEGIRIRVGRHMSRRVERALSKGDYEREELRLVGAVLSPHDIVLEVGAGLGLMSAYCAKRIGSDRVFACEADPDLEPCIRETYRLNGVQPTLDMCAVGARSGRVTLFRDKHLVSSSVVRRRVGVRPVEVPGKALNYLVEKIRPTLLIVDAEGAERDLFEGAVLPGVTRVVLELHERVIGHVETSQVRAKLSALGFQVDQRLSSSEHLVLRRLGDEEQEPEVRSSARETGSQGLPAGNRTGSSRVGKRDSSHTRWRSG
jgi:FkbM family methyltransferase